MSTLKFKTNIKCGGCVATVSPFLNQLADIEKWEVDTNNPDKILTVESNTNAEKLIIETVQKAGFTIESC